MRGKADHTFSFYFPPRITPAYAGKRWSRYETICIHQDHPRLCGEKTSNTVSGKTNQGSPPPMRGKDDGTLPEPISNRITPAYAGKSSEACKPVNSVKDHPRLCGEKFLRLVQPFQLLGSPPPMRGKAQWAFHGIVTIRITPAYAGKSPFVHNRLPEFEDHPRLCGEKVTTAFCGGRVEGITPAYAGKSRQRPPAECPDQDHPRLCGEK